MKKLFLAIMILTLPATLVYGHGLQIQFGHDGPYLWIRAAYDGDIALPFALITVHDPDGVEFQNGRSDRNGCFSFQPDRRGKWKLTVDDEMGHVQKLEIELSRTDIAQARVAKHTGASPWLRWLLGISLILLLSSVLYIWKKR